MSAHVIRPAAATESTACLELWVRACAARDGREVDGVAERARAKFERPALLLVADRGGELAGFALATPPGSGAPGDPADAAVLGLLAVSPEAQGAGLGRRLLQAMALGLAERGFPRAVLHVLADNAAAVGLYESEGWQRFGAPFEHSLLHRASQSYVRAL